MTSYTLHIQWHHETEFFSFDDKKAPRPGSTLRTRAIWDNYPEDTEYVTEVVEYRKQHKSKRVLKLRYDQLNNSGQALENQVWGIATLNFDLEKLNATATWTSDKPNRLIDGTAPAMLLPARLHEDLGREIATRQIRRQQKLRKDLIKLDPCCALTGETTLAVLEAAHIIDVKSKGAFDISNGLLLRADLHRLFDSGTLTIATNGAVSISPNSSTSKYYLNCAKSWKLKPAELARISNALSQRHRPKTTVEVGASG